jgi:hypothetical protein
MLIAMMIRALSRLSRYTARALWGQGMVLLGG